MRCIDADALLEELNASHFPGAPYVDAGISIAIGKVCDAPTIEPERKKGEWETGIIKDVCGYNHAIYACSACGKMSDDEFDFCPHCGSFNRGDKNVNE